MKREYITLIIISFLLSFVSLILMVMSIEDEKKLFGFFTISLFASLVSMVYSFFRLKSGK